MYPAERRQEILRWLEKDSSVTVAELASHFGVSRASIRRDLNHLRLRGLVRRTYGGAVDPDSLVMEAPFNERKVSRYEEKDRIGQAAAQLVGPGETIFIDGGTTTECMIPYLGDKRRLTVVTNALNIASRVAAYAEITLIVIGGTLHRRSQTLVGVLAHDNMRAYNMHFDKAFVAARGVSAEAGLTNASFEEIPMKRKAIESSSQAIVLVDSSKIGVIAAGQIAPVSRINRLITTREAPASEIEELRRLGLDVQTV